MPIQKISPAGLALIKEFESFVPFVYDDLRPLRGAKHGYRPWDGGTVKGTLTIGYGHTDAAKHPLKCTQGAVVSEAQASEILDVDLDECEGDVRRLVKVPLTQGQFDALVSFQFNSGCLGKSTLLKLLNAGKYGEVPDQLMRFTRSKGQVLKGLERRRAAEISRWNAHDDDGEDAGDVVEDTTGTVVPDAPPAPKPLGQSKTIWSAIAAFCAFIVQQVMEYADRIGQLAAYAPSWLVDVAALLVVIGIAAVIWSRWSTRQEHGV